MSYDKTLDRLSMYRRKHHPDCARHNCGTNLLSNGANIKTVASILGHSVLAHTKNTPVPSNPSNKPPSTPCHR